MDKFTTVIGLFLCVLFALSFVFHLMYAKGYVLQWAQKGYVIENQETIILSATPYASEEECKKHALSHCMYEVCAFVAADEADSCDADNMGWFAVVE